MLSEDIARLALWAERAGRTGASGEECAALA